jgi:DNA polymerase I-like protein with 3'-5' exonuclease and polymerase domains
VTRGRGEQEGGTRSGRFSVERVNLQAIPHDYKLKLLEEQWPVPTPRELIAQAAKQLEGWDLWEFDLAQAELRLAAAWANCDRMLDAFDAGRDLHGETASELFNVSPGDSDWKFYRQVGKRGNFTLCFGAGGETFVNMVAKETGKLLSIDEGEVLVEKWNRLYPEFRRTIDVWSNFADRNHFVPLASSVGFGTGRHRRFERFEATHKAFNQLVQGSLGEFARDWNLETERICAEFGIGGCVPDIGWTGLCLVIHDSQVVLLPAGERGTDIARAIEYGAAALWARFFDTPDPNGRVSPVSGFAEGKLWG